MPAVPIYREKPTAIRTSAVPVYRLRFMPVLGCRDALRYRRLLPRAFCPNLWPRPHASRAQCPQLLNMHACGPSTAYPTLLLSFSRLANVAAMIDVDDKKVRLGQHRVGLGRGRCRLGQALVRPRQTLTLDLCLLSPTHQTLAATSFNPCTAPSDEPKQCRCPSEGETTAIRLEMHCRRVEETTERKCGLSALASRTSPSLPLFQSSPYRGAPAG